MLRDTHSLITLDFIAKHGGKVREYKRQAPVYRQGDQAHELFYVLSGKVLVTIGTACGKEDSLRFCRRGNSSARIAWIGRR